MNETVTPPGERPAPGRQQGSRRQTVVLVGMMGAGKSAIGRRLATQLGLPFVDGDTEIEKAAGCSIADLFAAHGEAAFRDGERRVMARLLAGPACVLATGGGAFMDPDTRAAVAAAGVSVWLRADVDTLLARTARHKDRPLLNDGDPRQVLERLATERAPTYALADITVDSNDRPVEETTDAVIEALRAHGDG